MMAKCRRLVQYLVLSMSMLLVIGGTQAQLLIPPPSPPMPDFALNAGHPLAQVVIPRLIPVLIQDVSPRLGDVTLVPRVTAPLLTAIVDALAPYHPTAVGIYTRIERRPQEEWTLENMNIATLYAPTILCAAWFPTANKSGSLCSRILAWTRKPAWRTQVHRRASARPQASAQLKLV